MTLGGEGGAEVLKVWLYDEYQHLEQVYEMVGEPSSGTWNECSYTATRRCKCQSMHTTSFDYEMLELLVLLPGNLKRLDLHMKDNAIHEGCSCAHPIFI